MNEIILGVSYKVVRVGNDLWLAENLRSPHLHSVCYEKEDKYRNKYGRLYSWDAGMELANSVNGWHLPSNKEWDEFLINSGQNLLSLGGYALSVEDKITDDLAFDKIGEYGRYWSSSEEENGNYCLDLENC